MKRMMMLFGMVLASCAVMAATQVVDGIEWTYTVTNGEASVESGSGWLSAIPQSTTGAIIIPSTLGDHPVTSIGDWAFDDCSGLTNVTIPNSVTSIGDGAFWGCSGLTSVTIPSSVTSIGDAAFTGCSALTSVTIPEGVASIGRAAFWACSGLTSVTIPSSVTSISREVFRGCSGLTIVTIPNGVTSIGADAFEGCSGLTSVAIPSSVTCIGNGAFSCCSGLTSATIPSSVTSIGDYAFYGCSGLTSMDFEGAPPSGLSFAMINQDSAIRYNIAYEDEWLPVIAECGFTNATAYTPPKPDGGPYTESVGETEWTFMVSGGKASVTKANPATGAVTIPSTLGGRSVTSIDTSAFQKCTELTSVTIPASVTTIGNSAFRGCTLLADVYFEGDTLSLIGVDAFRECYWDLIMHVPATWKGRGRTICGYTVLKGSMFIVK